MQRKKNTFEPWCWALWAELSVKRVFVAEWFVRQLMHVSISALFLHSYVQNPVLVDLTSSINLICQAKCPLTFCQMFWHVQKAFTSYILSTVTCSVIQSFCHFLGILYFCIKMFVVYILQNMFFCDEIHFLHEN